MSTFEDDMAGFEEEWTEAQENAGTQRLLPDGDYQAIITEARVEKSDWDEWQFMCAYSVPGVGGRRSWDSLEQEVGRSIAAERSKVLGYDGPLAGLQQACESEMFIDLVVDIKVKTKAGDTRDFTSVYVNHCHGKATEEQKAQLAQHTAGVGAGTTTDDDDDIPF